MNGGFKPEKVTHTQFWVHFRCVSYLPTQACPLFIWPAVYCMFGMFFWFHIEATDSAYSTGPEEKSFHCYGRCTLFPRQRDE